MYLSRLSMGLAIMICGVTPLLAQREPPPSAPDSVVDNDSVKAGKGKALPKLPGVTINREQGWVDLNAKVVLREGDWLELLACSPNSREHESIVTVSARPSHIHLSLLLLGAEAGKPMTWKRDGETIITNPPRGPKVKAYFVVEEGGEAKEIPVNEWVVDQESGEKLEDNIWLFTGSQLFEVDGKPVYLADLHGTVMSLVNFGDDLLARSTDRTDQGATGFWKANTAEIPELGTDLKLRLKPERKAKGKPKGEAEAEGDGENKPADKREGGSSPADKADSDTLTPAEAGSGPVGDGDEDGS